MLKTFEPFLCTKLPLPPPSTCFMTSFKTNYNYVTYQPSKCPVSSHCQIPARGYAHQFNETRTE